MESTKQAVTHEEPSHRAVGYAVIYATYLVFGMGFAGLLMVLSVPAVEIILWWVEPRWRDRQRRRAREERVRETLEHFRRTGRWLPWASEELLAECKKRLTQD